MTGYETWTAAVGQTFEAATEAGVRHPLRLASVGPDRRANGWLGYTLQFTAAPESAVQQQTYQLTGAGITEAVFLVPTGRTADALTLEAVFVVPDTDGAATDGAATGRDDTNGTATGRADTAPTDEEER